ncbi:replication-relaxation family protein [Neobacillus sp. NRS-1170]|uniref:replication-relaxation family protein n=1 Tax=Neobacillus sp. NRS-1170 TaxID=3233898 RepID=UPI003D2801F2
MKRLSERQERMLLSLKKLDFLNRDQISTIHRLGTKRNTNRILKELSPFLSSFREENSTIYFLNKDGREYVNSKKERKKNKFVNHVLMRNDFYIFAGYPHEWKNEMKIRDDKFTVVCDAWFKSNGKYHFLEVDSLQKMKANRAKITQYKGLFENGAITEHLGYFPLLIWLTTSEFRKRQLIELCEGLPSRVYTINDIR